MASSSSMSHQTASYLSPDDSTYQSLLSLLSSPSASSSTHLSLLLSNSLYGSITLYLSRLDTDSLPHFIQTLATSKAFWDVTEIVKSTPNRIHEDVLQPSPTPTERPSLLRRAYDLHLASARAGFSHMELLLTMNKNATGWYHQRKARYWIDGIAKTLKETIGQQQQSEGRGSVKSADFAAVQIARLSILTGLLVGLHAYRQQKRSQNSPGISVGSSISRAEGYWKEAFEEIMTGLQQRLQPAVVEPVAKKPAEDDWELEFRKTSGAEGELAIAEKGRRYDTVRTALLVPLHLAAQASPLLSESTLDSLAPEPLLTLLPLPLLRLFQPPYLTFPMASTSSKPDLSHTFNPSTHALFPFLGPLSRLLAAGAENAANKLRGNDAERLFLGESTSDGGSSTSMESTGLIPTWLQLSQELQNHFVFSRLGLVSSANLEAAERESLTALWTSLKGFLFLTVQLFDAALDGLVEVLPAPVFEHTDLRQLPVNEVNRILSGDSKDVVTSNIPPFILAILQKQVKTLMNLTFITFSLTNSEGEGTDQQDRARRLTSNEIYNRFSTYRRTLYGALEVLKGDSGASTTLLVDLEQDLANNSSSTRKACWHDLSLITHYLDVSEILLLASSLPDQLLQQSILEQCRPYLRDATYLAPFESSNSVLLACFEGRKSISQDLTAFFLRGIFESFEQGHMSGDQVRHSIKTVVGCLSDMDDARAWWVVERLGEEIERVRQSRQGGGSEEKRGLSFDKPAAASEISYEAASASKEIAGKEEKESNDISYESAPAEQEVTLKSNNTPSTTSIDPSQHLLDLQLAYIDLLPFVNLVLLKSVLRQVKVYILEAEGSSAAVVTSNTATEKQQNAQVDATGTLTTDAPEGKEMEGSKHLPEASAVTSVMTAQGRNNHEQSDEKTELPSSTLPSSSEQDQSSSSSLSSRIALCEATFKALQAMDDTARQEGVGWWLEHREAFGV